MPGAAMRVKAVLPVLWFSVLGCVCLSLLSQLSPTAALADAVSFADGTFAPPDWDISIFYVQGNGGSVTAEQMTSGGNPDACRKVTTVVHAGPPYSMITSFHRYIPGVYDPASQGAIAWIDYREDAKMFSGGGDGQGSGIAIRQGGNVFLGPRFGTPDGAWTAHTILGLTESEFEEWPAYPDHHPDFSTSGDPIELGFYRGNSTGTSGYTIVGGIDNWSIVVHSGESLPSGACCYPDGSCRVETAMACRGAGGTYQGDGIECVPGLCPSVGACCFCDGHCEMLDESACLSDLGAHWLGTIVDCSPDLCPDSLRGSCCFLDQSCLYTTQCTCDAMWGHFIPAVPCDPNPCGPLFGACCLPNGSCAPLTGPGCESQSGVFRGNGTICDPDPCGSEIEGLVWYEDEVIDSSVHDTPGGSQWVEHTPSWGPWSTHDEWHFVYARGGNIYHRMRSSVGWDPLPELLTQDAAIQRNPKLVFSGGVLHVIWEDLRSGSVEIYTRRWDGLAWGPEEVLVQGAGVASASIAGTMDSAFLVWQTGVAGAQSIRGRAWDGSVWGPVESVSLGAAGATEPSVSRDAEQWGRYHVAWSDARHGQTEIYIRSRTESGQWDPEQRLTDMPGFCRAPSVHATHCCGDYIRTLTTVAFTNDQAAGVPETYVACVLEGDPVVVQRVSSPDGVASEYPVLGGYTFWNMEGMGYSQARSFVTWTDRASPGAETHSLAYMPGCGFGGETEVLSDHGEARSLFIAYAREGDQNAKIAAVWADGRGLICRRARMRSCLNSLYDVPAAILLVPGGVPADSIQILTRCRETEGVDGMRVQLVFSPGLDSTLTWDDLQVHPSIPERLTDMAGKVAFRIRGGGCSRTGSVALRVNGADVRVWQGAKSPDVNGDCMVTVLDSGYIQSMVGTNDFCADLDGSGVVDGADVSIAEMLIGSACASSMSVDTVPQSEGFRLDAGPNPARGSVLLRLGTPQKTRTRLRIYDASGRIIRDLGSPSGGTVIWDARDGGGHPVASGIYFAVARRGEQERHRALIILR
jgi:hypothetical protein